MVQYIYASELDQIIATEKHIDPQYTATAGGKGKVTVNDRRHEKSHSTSTLSSTTTSATSSLSSCDDSLELKHDNDTSTSYLPHNKKKSIKSVTAKRERESDGSRRHAEIIGFMKQAQAQQGKQAQEEGERFERILTVFADKMSGGDTYKQQIEQLQKTTAEIQEGMNKILQYIQGVGGGGKGTRLREDEEHDNTSNINI